ncbi:MAG: ABC transporter permease subunit [Clostridiales bacterium]|jgi:ABC-2 type transport system permease protein|nr:ABC transporter permease subunit [Clostridiales bacterium]MBS4031462.1 ABC transporter permease subunit [Clostridiales bacterium]
MWAEFKHTLRRLRWQIVGWAGGVAAYGLMMAYLFPSIADMGDVMYEYINMFPEAMMAFFENIYLIGTPMGYMDVYFFSYMHMIIGILAIGTGAGLLVGDEEKGVLDLVLAQPVSRTSLFFGRFLGLAAALAAILVAGWLSWSIPAGSVGLELSWLQLLLPFLPLFVVLLLFTAIAVLLSMIMPAARIAGMLTGAILVGNFLLLGLSNINDKLKPLMKLTPLYYYQGGLAVEGLNGTWLLGLLLCVLLAIAVAWLLFLRRDIRVGGERSWKLPVFGKRSTTS